MKVLEELDESRADDDSIEETKHSYATVRKKRKLKNVNVLYRPLLKQHLENERIRKMRYDLNNSLSTRNNGSDSDDDKEPTFDERAEELDDEDTELDEYEAMSFADRLEKVVAEMREKHNYCFWCKFQYLDAEMDGCPGLTEDEHG